MDAKYGLYCVLKIGCINSNNDGTYREGENPYESIYFSTIREKWER